MNSRSRAARPGGVPWAAESARAPARMRMPVRCGPVRSLAFMMAKLYNTSASRFQRETRGGPRRRAEAIMTVAWDALVEDGVAPVGSDGAAGGLRSPWAPACAPRRRHRGPARPAPRRSSSACPPGVSPRVAPGSRGSLARASLATSSRRLTTATSSTGSCRVTPEISLHIPWDEPEDPAALRTYAEQRGLTLSTTNSNTFEDQPGQAVPYKFGSLSHTDAGRTRSRRSRTIATASISV